MSLYLLLLVFCFDLLALEAPAVVPSFEQNPSHLVWSSIQSPHFEVIFPQELEAKAKEVTHLLEAAYPAVTKSLEVSPPKISVILHNQLNYSNAFVTLAPRRSEWFMSPPVDPELASVDWAKTLAIHEFRHVVQFEKTRKGFNRALEIFLGEIGQAIGVGLTLPPWFLEGDAVGIETALTDGGRGRLPLFDRDLKALLLSGQKFNYEAAHLGSYRTFLPNHYVYGYFFTTALRRKYGDSILSKLSDEASERSWNPLTFYNSFQRLTGERFEDFYWDTISELKGNWEKINASLVALPSTHWPKSSFENWSQYLYPQITTDGHWIVLKRSLSQISQFVLIKSGQEQGLIYPGMLVQEYPLKLRSDRMAWVEQDPHPRWGMKKRSRLRVYDFKRHR